MKLIRRIGLLLLFVVPLCVCPSLQAGPLGETAPELQIREWIEGGPVNLPGGLGKNIFVIEFWHTECPHCLDSLPYLSMLQEQYRKDGVLFIGISVEDPQTVRAFLKDNPVVGYTLAVDQAEKTYDSYMGAFGISGVPHVFVIGRQGRVLWEGHPMDQLDEVLGQMVAGRYDLEAVRNLARARKLFKAYIYLSVETDENDIAREVGQRVFTYGRGNAGVMHKLARFIVFNEKNRTPDTELGVRAAKRAYDLTDGADREIIETYGGALYRAGEKEKARGYLQKARALKCEEEGKTPEECGSE